MKIILLFILFLYSFIGYCQNKIIDSLKIDSLKNVLPTQKEDSNKVNTLNELSIIVLKNDERDKALQYAKQALILSQKLHFTDGEGNACYNYGLALKGKIYKGEQGTFGEVLTYFNNALSIFKTTKNELKIADCYSQISRSYQNMDQNLSEAVKNMLSALRIYEEIGNRHQIATCYMELGTAYGSDDRTAQEGLNSLKTALQIFKELKDSAQIAYTAHLVGDMHSNYKHQEALKYYDTCLSVYKAMGNRGPDFGIPWTQGGIGDIYMSQASKAIEMGDFKNASKKLHSALEIFKERLAVERAGKMSHRQTYPELGDCYLYLSKISSGEEKKNNLSQSKKYYTLALQLAVKSNNKALLSNSYYNLSEVSVAFKDYKQAYEYHKNFITYRDSIYNEDNTKKTVQAQMQYSFDKKQVSTKAAQDKKDALGLAEIKNQKLVRNFSLAGTVAVASFGSFSFYRYRRRRKLQSEQEMLNERLRISRELHDDMGSTLGSISIYSEVAKNRSAKNENADEAISKIGIASRELIEKMSDIVWSINPNNENFEQLQNRMQAFAAMILTPRNINYHFNVDEEIQKLKLSAERRKNIFLIFKEAVYNIVKYAECSKAEIKLSLHNDRFQMQIKDDGKGFNVDSPNAETNNGTLGGNGLKNMKARAEDIRAAINIQSDIGIGTTIQFAFTV